MVTRQLLCFIREERVLGVSHELIVQKLKERGWSDRVIEEAFMHADHPDVPVPPTSRSFVFLDLLLLSWDSYMGKWKRYLALVGVYFGLLFSSAFILSLFFVARISRIPAYAFYGNGEYFLQYMAPIVLPGLALFLLIQAWFIATMYGISTSKYRSFSADVEGGIDHMFQVLVIKISIVALLAISFAPPFLIALFSGKPITLLAFLPISAVVAIISCLYLSLSLPAYFQGARWGNALRTSYHTIHGKLWNLLLNLGLFGIVAVFLSQFLEHTGPIAIIVALGVIAPIQSLFLLALYNYLARQEKRPAKISERRSEFQEETQEVPITFPASTKTVSSRRKKV